MTRPAITIFTPTDGCLHPCTRWWLKNAKYSGHFEHVIHVQDPLEKVTDTNPTRARYRNIAAARNAARALALKTDAEWFLSLDSDVTPPIDALETFATAVEGFGPATTPNQDGGTRMACVGGWYPQKGLQHIITVENGARTMRAIQRWAAGAFVKPGRFWNAHEPRIRKFYQSHLVPLGCAFLHRSILEMTEFRDGCAESQVIIDHDTGARMFWGECVEFGHQLESMGEACQMHPEIICRHWSGKSATQ